MRLAVISDVHGNLPALEAVVADIKKRQVDSTVNLGDCVTSPLWPKETFEALQSLGLPTVRGNHDGSKNFPRINFRPQDGLLGTR
jgi:predicted phosphodiesterase